jgi:hypothetical protein
VGLVAPRSPFEVRKKPSVGAVLGMVTKSSGRCRGQVGQKSVTGCYWWSARDRQKCIVPVLFGL